MQLKMKINCRYTGLIRSCIPQLSAASMRAVPTVALHAPADRKRNEWLGYPYENIQPDPFFEKCKQSSNGMHPIWSEVRNKSNQRKKHAVWIAQPRIWGTPTNNKLEWLESGWGVRVNIASIPDLPYVSMRSWRGHSPHRLCSYSSSLILSWSRLYLKQILCAGSVLVALKACEKIKASAGSAQSFNRKPPRASAVAPCR